MFFRCHSIGFIIFNSCWLFKKTCFHSNPDNLAPIDEPIILLTIPTQAIILARLAYIDFYDIGESESIYQLPTDIWK